MVEENINIETIENQGIDTEEKGLNQKNETILDSEVVDPEHNMEENKPEPDSEEIKLEPEPVTEPAPSREKTGNRVIKETESINATEKPYSLDLYISSMYNLLLGHISTTKFKQILINNKNSDNDVLKLTKIIELLSLLFNGAKTIDIIKKIQNIDKYTLVSTKIVKENVLAELINNFISFYQLKITKEEIKKFLEEKL